jgi:hypothetical protein
VRLRGALWAAAAALLAVGGCTAPKSDLPVPVFLACNEINEILSAMPFERVKHEAGTVSQPLTASQSKGCRVEGEGSRSRLSDLERTSQHSPDGRLRELLPARGWREDTRFATDRADGDTFAFERGGVICYFSARWGAKDADTEDNVDPEALAPDRYEISVGCALPGT